MFNEMDIRITPRNPNININIGNTDKSISLDILNASRGSGIAIKTDTTSNWNSKLDYIPLKGEAIVYTDHGQINNDGNIIDVPGMKIGDGSSYLIDLPFLGEDETNMIMAIVNDHISNDSMHVSDYDRAFWNTKLNCRMMIETLIFTRE